MANPSVKELKCSDCVFFKHHSRVLQHPINHCTLEVSQYRKERLAYGDDLTMCNNGRTEMDQTIEDKGW